MAAIVALFHNVFIEKAKPAEMTKSGIVIPIMAKDVERRGVVRYVGSHVRKPIVVGAAVVFQDFAGQEVVVNGVTLVVMRDTEILAVIEGEDEESEGREEATASV